MNFTSPARRFLLQPLRWLAGCGLVLLLLAVCLLVLVDAVLEDSRDS